MPPGVDVDDRFHRECAVRTESGEWESQFLYFDVAPMLAEHARLLYNGRRPRSALARRLATGWQRGTGRPLDVPDDDDGGTPPPAA